MMVVGGHKLHLYHLLDATLETDYRFGSILQILKRTFHFNPTLDALVIMFVRFESHCQGFFQRNVFIINVVAIVIACVGCVAFLDHKKQQLGHHHMEQRELYQEELAAKTIPSSYLAVPCCSPFSVIVRDSRKLSRNQFFQCQITTRSQPLPILQFQVSKTFLKPVSSFSSSFIVFNFVSFHGFFFVSLVFSFSFVFLNQVTSQLC